MTKQDYLLANGNIKHELNGLVFLAITRFKFLKSFWF